MKKEEIDREQILKYFSQALLLKNRIVSDKARMLEMYDDQGFLKQRYSKDSATQIMDELEKNAAEFETALASFKDCFDVTLKDYADYVADYLKKNFSTKTALKTEKVPNSNYMIVKLELKTDIPELGLKAKEAINLAVVDKKFNIAKTNILKSYFTIKASDTRIPLLHYRSEDSILLVNEEQNQYSTRAFFEITKDFMEERYLPDDYEVNLE